MSPKLQAKAADPVRWVALAILLPITMAACGLWLDDEAKIERSRLALEGQQYSAVILDMKNVLQESPDNAVARNLLGRALAASGDLAGAENQLRRALELGQPLEDFRIAFAEALVATGKLQQALDIADPTAAANDREAALLWLYRGDAQAGLGNVAEALRSYQQAQRLGGHEAEALLRAAELYWGAGNFKDARAFAESALLTEPGNLDAHLTFVAILMELRRWQEAEDKLNRALSELQLDPFDGGYVLAALAEVHLAQDDIAAARAMLGRVTEVWPADDWDVNLLRGRVALAEGDHETAARELFAYLSAFPEATEAMRMLGAAQLGRGSINQAKAQLGRALAADPDDIETRILLARAYLASGQFVESREVLEPLLMLAPQHHIALSLLGVLELSPPPSDDTPDSIRGQLARGELRQALVGAERLVQDRPNDARALNLLGLSQLANGLLESAIESFSLAAATERSQIQFRVNLARAHLANSSPELASKAMDEIAVADGAELSMMRRAIVIHLDESRLLRWLNGNPDDWEARLALANGYVEASDFAAAATQYELLLEAGLDDPFAHNNLAWSYYELGDSRAREQAETAYDLAPNEADVVDTLGWILVAEGQRERGVSLLQDAHLLRPSDSMIAYHLAYALSRSGARVEAAAILERLAAAGGGPARIKESARALLAELQETQ